MYLLEKIQIITQYVSCHYLSSFLFSSLSLKAEKRLPEVRGGFVYLGKKTGSGGLGFQT